MGNSIAADVAAGASTPFDHDLQVAAVSVTRR
jgi:hypothetical protein